MTQRVVNELREIQLAFARHLRDPACAPKPEDIPEARAAVYRELFFNNIQGALDKAFPVTREILTAAHWVCLVREFWREHRCQSPGFPRLPAEFLLWFASRGLHNDWEPPYLYELLTWEHAELETLLADNDESLPFRDVMEGVPVLSLSLRVHAFMFPVQQISGSFQPSEPLETPIFLACFRNRDLRVDFMSLSPAAAWLLEHLREANGLTGRAHLQALASAMGAERDDVAQEGKALLDGFVDRGVIVGVV